jgi:hypothetical protein
MGVGTDGVGIGIAGPSCCSPPWVVARVDGGAALTWGDGVKVSIRTQPRNSLGLLVSTIDPLIALHSYTAATAGRLCHHPLRLNTRMATRKYEWFDGTGEACNAVLL